MDELPIAAPGRPGCREVAGLYIATVRHFPGDTTAAPALAAAGLPGLPPPRTLASADAQAGPWLAWRGPQESLALSLDAAPLQALLRALEPGRSQPAMAAELSDALLTFELHGPHIDDWLAHLFDADAIPRHPGRASRARMVDVPALLLRLAPERLWLLGDRTIAAYLRNWLAFSHQGAFAEPAASR
jgi:sarcosine oxidase gamma subunit